MWTPIVFIAYSFENAPNSFVERLLITMAFYSRLATVWQLLTKGIVLKKGLTTPFCSSNVNAYRIHSVFIGKRSNVKGQRFRQQTRIETKTKQCERGLRVVSIIPFLYETIEERTCLNMKHLSFVAGSRSKSVILATVQHHPKTEQYEHVVMKT